MGAGRSSWGAPSPRFRLLAFLLIVSSGRAAEAQKTPPCGHCLAGERPAQSSTPVPLACPREGRPEDSSGAFRIITTPPLVCENECEVRFPDGVCRLNMTCFFAVGRTSSRGALGTATRASDVGFEEIGSGGGGGTSSCRGPCVFEDVAGSCRLDLLCPLDQDADEKRRFLERHSASEDVIQSVTARAG